MGNYSEIKYSDMYKVLCKELCCEMEKFEDESAPETLKNVKDLIESICGLQELEAGKAMREYAEDRWGYDMDEGMTYHYRYGIPDLYNAAPRVPSRSGGRSNPNTRYGYPSYGPNRGGMYPGAGMPDYSKRDRMDHGMDRADREDGRIGYGDDETYMLRQENGRPRMTPYAMHTGTIPKKLTEEQYKKWMRNLENSDGTDGPKFTKQQVEAEAKKLGVDYMDVGIETLYSCVNMLYSDFCEVAQKYGVNNLGFYIHLADAFLDDDDFDGTGKEKLSIYYHTIVEHDK